MHSPIIIRSTQLIRINHTFYPFFSCISPVPIVSHLPPFKIVEGFWAFWGGGVGVGIDNKNRKQFKILVSKLNFQAINCRYFLPPERFYLKEIYWILTFKHHFLLEKNLDEFKSLYYFIMTSWWTSWTSSSSSMHFCWFVYGIPTQIIIFINRLRSKVTGVKRNRPSSDQLHN